jgi:hypothetical protein
MKCATGTYIIAKVLDAGYFEVGKKKMEFTRKAQPMNDTLSGPLRIAGLYR